MFDSVYPCVYVYFSVLRVFCLRFGSQQKSSSSTIQQVSRIDMDDSIRVFQDWANVSKTQTFQAKSQVPGKVLRNCCWHRCIPQHFGWLAQFPRPQLSKHSHKNDQLSKTHKKKLPKHSGLNSTTTVECKKIPKKTFQDAPKCWFQKKSPIFPHLFGAWDFCPSTVFWPPKQKVPLGFPYGAAACAAAASAAAFSCRRRFSSCTSCRRYLSSVENPLDFFPHIRFTTNALRFWVGHLSFFKVLEKMMKIVDLTKKTHGKW